MIKKNQGHLTTLSSFAGFVGSRNLPLYSSTKFAIFGLHEAIGLRQKIKRSNIDFTIVCPNIVKTQMVMNNYKNKTRLKTKKR